MEEQILLRIKRKLTKIGEEYDLLKPFMQERLYELELCITKKEEECRRGKELIENSTFSVTSLAEEVKCSRTTLYNHEQLLQRYIEVSVTIYEEYNLLKDIEDLKNEIKKLKDQIRLMEIRDVEVECQKVENKQLAEKVRSFKKDNEKLLERIAMLNNENQTLKKRIFP